jgi:hypothetical protein
MELLIKRLLSVQIGGVPSKVVLKPLLMLLRNAGVIKDATSFSLVFPGFMYMLALLPIIWIILEVEVLCFLARVNSKINIVG